MFSRCSMLLPRIQSLAILFICAALAIAGWKALAPRGGSSDEASVRSGGGSASAGRGELTIPVEIVVSGEEPRLREIRVSR